MASSYDRGVEELFKEGLEEVYKENRELTFEAYTRIVERTPVDTGRARQNWGIAPTEPGDAPDAATVILSNADPMNGYVIYNNLDYIEDLEMGSSKQAPAGFIRLSLAELGLDLKGSIGDTTL